MNVLVVGSGGREHALVWKLVQSNKVSNCYVAPGNAGTAREPKAQNIDIDPMDFPKLIEFAKDNNVKLTIIGPEAPLAAGIVDEFNKAGLKCFGPTQDAAEIESSKAFCKEFLQRHNVYTSKFDIFTDPVEAKAYVDQEGTPIVVKADGLAEGKGVILAQTVDEAHQAIDRMFAGEFGNAGMKVVIEEFLQGNEISYIVMVDGDNVLPFSSVRDHKALNDDGKGPNTGGMGAYSPAPTLTPDLDDRIMHEIIMPVIKGLKNENRAYQGFLYAGLMITPEGNPAVLEFNCRLGDPETQTLMLRLEDDLYTLVKAAIEQRLDEIITQWDPRPSVCVVMASEGYPGNYPTGDIITGLPAIDAPDLKVFHSSTKKGDDGQFLTSGGRVISVTGLGDDFSDAISHVYDVVKHINWEHKYFRTDIGKRAIKIG